MKNNEIAKLLHISPATVSLALNNKPGVSPHTRRRVLELKNQHSSTDEGKQLIEQKESSAGTPAGSKGKIGILIYRDKGDVIDDTPLFVILINSIDENLRLFGYEPSMIYFRSPEVDDYIEKVDELELAGVIVIATEMTDEGAVRFRDRMKTPFVLVDAAFDCCDVDSVVMNNHGGISQAVDYAISQGHRKIGFIRSRNICKNFSERFSSYKLALEKAGIPYDESLVFDVGASAEAAREDMSMYLAQKRPLPTILIASNDRIAMGAMKSLEEAGYHVPEDISIIGFDDMPMTKFMIPPLTTVQIYFDVNGRVAVLRLISRIENTAERSYHLKQTVETRLVIRESVKKLEEAPY